MAVKASSFKDWCVENISPQSWTRICLKCTNEVTAKGYSLKEMEDLKSDIDLDNELFDCLNAALNDYYNLSVNIEMLATV